MLTTRLWMGSLLVVMAAAVLLLDAKVYVYPFLWLAITFLAVTAWVEFVEMLGPGRRPQVLMSGLGVLVLTTLNWLGHWEWLAGGASPWAFIFGGFVVMVLAIFLWELVLFREPNRCTERMGLTLLILVYLGLLPSFIVQLRWLPETYAAVPLALAVFVPKACDIGAYFTGKLLGRHPMTPLLSPKKTWEGAIGGLFAAVLVAIALDRGSGVGALWNNLGMEIAFGVIIGTVGMLGDLAESLLKRDCRQKDASHAIPGFGGVLDVVDSILFSAPVSYAWLSLTCA